MMTSHKASHQPEPVVITRQITSSGGTSHALNGYRDWNYQLFRCTGNWQTCYHLFLCPICFAATTARRIGEPYCVGLFACVPGGIIPLRLKTRLILGIRGNICIDCLAGCCCCFCALCQMKRELDSVGWPE